MDKKRKLFEAEHGTLEPEKKVIKARPRTSGNDKPRRKRS